MSDITVDCPVHVDDSGTGRDGTVVDAAWVDTLITAINNQVLSAANPTVTPEDIIDKVVAAGGTAADLDARLDLEHNEDGTHKLTGTLGTLATTTQLLGGIGGVNLVQNDDDLLWPDGDALAPDGYTLTGAGASVARCGTGLGDVNRKIGDFCARMTRAGANCNLAHIIAQGAAFTRAEFIKSLYAAGGAWVKCSTANAARVGISDNAGSTYSVYHTGGGAWEWLPVTRQVNAGATALIIFFDISNSDCDAYWSGRTLFLIDGNLLLPRYVPCPVTYGGTIHLAVSGVLAVANNLGRFQPARRGIVKDVQLHVKTAPTGINQIDVDVNTNTDVPAAAVYPTMASMFTATHPMIAATNFMGGRQPDGTYARRCLRGPTSGATVGGLGGLLTIDIDTVGGTIAGADLDVEIRVMQYTSPFERFQTY